MASKPGSGRWIRRLNQFDDARPDVVCFPHSGGTAGFYAPLARALGPDANVLAVQYPGRQDRWREPFADSVEELAEQACQALSPRASRPPALFGHSMGAAVAFEVALRLESQGCVPRALFVSGRGGPALERIPGPERGGRPDDATLLAELRALHGSDGDVLANDEVMRRVLPAVRADYRAAACYRYRGSRTLSTEIVALIGDSDRMVPVERARAWGRHGARPLRIYTFSGGHFYVLSHMDSVANVLRQHGDLVEDVTLDPARSR